MPTKQQKLLFISHCEKENMNIWSSIFKTMAFLCFQTTQVTRMIRELRPLQFAHLLRETSNSTAPPPRETGCTDLWRHCRHVKLRVRHPTFGKTVSRPTPMIDGQRNKKFAFKWSPTFPNSFPWGKFDSPQEKKFGRPTCCCRNQKRRVSIGVDLGHLAEGPGHLLSPKFEGTQPILAL